jgi:tetratricopeptide (TPR) repeat protein
MWNSEIYYFLNYDNCDNLNPSAYTAANRNPVPNQTTNKGTASYRMDNANKLYFAGYYEQATASYAKAVKLDPSQSEVWINMANSLYLLPGRIPRVIGRLQCCNCFGPAERKAILGKGEGAHGYQSHSITPKKLTPPRRRLDCRH